MDKSVSSPHLLLAKHGSMEAWKHGSMEAWKHGSMEAWKHGSMEAWKHGSMEAWKHENSAVIRCSVTRSGLFLVVKGV
ncbi:hypothetical protein AHX51_29365 [Salmonella enterica subsp. diarizonae]|nr:hypothetical protein [Salmonella enterica subsp. diarizonae]